MTVRCTTVSLAGVSSLIAATLGVYVIPTFATIFADMLPGEALPWPTRIVISAAPFGFIALAVFGGALLILTDSWRRARWVHGALVSTLAFALGFTVVALFWPIMRLLEEADKTESVALSIKDTAGPRFVRIHHAEPRSPPAVLELGHSQT
jgi:hypothetical protein